MACPEQRTKPEAEAKMPMHLASPVTALLTLHGAIDLLPVMTEVKKTAFSVPAAFLSYFKETPS